MKGIEPQPDIETSSDAYARRFSGKVGAFFLARQEAVLRAALGAMPPGTLLDVGGGHAQLSGPLAASGWQVTVLGSTPECGDRLALDPRNNNVRFVAGDLSKPPFEDRSFDVVISFRTMAHIADPDRFVSGMCRLARRSVIVDYPEAVSLNILSSATFGLKHRVEGDTRHFRNFSRASLAAIFARHGFGTTTVKRQFFLPMALHRAAKGAAPLQLAEKLLAASGLTGRLGNPGVLRADRQGA